MRKFAEQLDKKLNDKVNLETIEWIGKRLEETGPNGYKYMNTTIKWWDQWKAMVEQISIEGQRQSKSQ